MTLQLALLIVLHLLILGYGKCRLIQITISDPTVESPTFGLPVNTSSEDSTYLITLTVTTSNGCDSIITDSIVIHPLPEVVFNTPLLDSW